MEKRTKWHWMALAGLGLSLAFLSGGCKSDASDGDSNDGAGGRDAAGDGDDPSGALSAPSNLDDVSGTRIRRVWQTGGGARIASKLWDEDLDEPCLFNLAEDEVMRCIPGTGNSVLFADADCTQPILFAAAADSCGEDRGDYGRYFLPPDECGVLRSRIVRAGAPVDSGETVYDLYLGECNPMDMDTDVDFVTGETVEPEEFVKAEYVVQERTSEVGTRWLHSEDDGWFYDSMMDLDTDEPCTPTEVLSDGKLATYCVGPSAASFSDGFYGYADSDCSELAAATSTGCSAPLYVTAIRQDPEGCSRTEIFEAGDKLNTVYETTDSTCVAAVGEFDVSPYRYGIGPAVTELPQLEIGLAESEGRLTTQVYSFDGVAVAPLGTFWDTALNGRCQPVRFESGATVCVPGPRVNFVVSESRLYSDDACSQPVAPAYELTCSDETSFKYILHQGGGICAAPAAVFEAGLSVSGADVTTGNTGDCNSANASTDSIWVEEGPELDPLEVFVEITEE